MVRLREVRLLKYTYTVHWQFGDSPTTDSGMRSESSSKAEYICLPTCLPVCLWVCLFVYQKGILPLASDLYKLCHCLGLKHNYCRDVPKSKQSKLVNTKKIWWWLWITLVAQVVSMSVQCSKGFEHEQNNYLHICLPQAYYPLFLKLDFYV